MGGRGPGHKSWEARRARLVNIQKARAARKRAPLPWRSGMESRIIEQLVWQWFLEARGWRLEAGKSRGKSGMQIPRRFAPRNDNLKGKAASSSGSSHGLTGIREADRPSAPLRTSRTPNQRKPWAKVRVARFLGVSHTWVNKLVKKFEADPERMRRKMAAFAPASIEKLERARAETRWEREHGRLRGPIRRRRVKVTIQGKKETVVAATGVERKRRQEEIDEQRAWLRGEKNQQQIPHTAASVHVPLSRQAGRPIPFDCARGRRNDNMHIAYREVPEWAKGLLLPRDPALRPAQGQPYGLSTRTPRPMPFAFRRRR